MAQATAPTSLASLRRQDAISAPAEMRAGFDTVGGFELMQRAAKVFAASDIVPPQYKDNIANCVIAVDMAMRMGANPLMVMQNLYLVYNRPSWSAKFLIATINKCGRFTALRYEFQGEAGTDQWGCRAVATELATGEKLSGPLITIGLAKKEGWYDKKDKHGKAASKWPSMPELMLCYRAASWFVSAYAPEIAMGLQTAEEVHDTYDLERAAGGHYEISLEEMKAEALTAAEEAPAPDDKGTSKGRGKQQAATSQPDQPAAQPEAEHAAAPQAGLTHDPHTGELYGTAPGNNNMITCPNSEKQVDELDCVGKSCRDGCPQFM